MVTIRNLKALAAVLFFAVSIWSQTPQEIVFNSAGLIAAIERFNTGKTDMNIIVAADFEITQRIINNEGHILTIMSATSTPRTLNRETTASLFKVQKGTLILQNITIDGKSKNIYEAPFLNEALVFVTGGGIFEMKAGTTLKNNSISGTNGAGVYVDSYGIFNMSGGEITGNKTDLSGGGVYIYALRATFNMTGGKITGNECGTSATSYSGGVHFANSPFSTDKNTDKTPSVFKVGGTAIIKDNYKKNGTPSNVYMAGNRYITLNHPLEDEMEIWVTKVAESGLFVNAGAEPEDYKYFEADEGSQIFYEAVGKLKMVPGYDIDLSKTEIQFTALSGYSASTPAEYEIEVTNIGKTINHLRAYTAGEHADYFILDTTKLGGNMILNAVQKFTVKPKAELGAGIYKAFVLVSGQIGEDEFGPAVMRRIEVEFKVSEQFKFQVTVEAGESFAIPLNGKLGGDLNWGKPYNWLIDWGDGTPPETKSNFIDGAPQNSLTSNGIPHIYATANTYTITITSAGLPDAWLGAFGFNENPNANKAKITKLITPFSAIMTRTQAQINGTSPMPTHEWAYAFYGCENMVIGDDFNIPFLNQNDADREGVFYATFAGITAEQNRDILTIVDSYILLPQNAKFTFAGSTGFDDHQWFNALWGGEVVQDIKGFTAKVQEFANFSHDVTARCIGFDIDKPFTISGPGTFTIEGNSSWFNESLKRSFDGILFTVEDGANLVLENVVIYDNNASHKKPLVNVISGELSIGQAVVFGIGNDIGEVVQGDYSYLEEGALIIAWSGENNAYDAYTSEDLAIDNTLTIDSVYWKKFDGIYCDVRYRHFSNSGYIKLSQKCSEDRTLYFDQSDGKFYASDEEYDDINQHPPYIIFSPKNVVDIPNVTWDPESNRLTFSDGVGWKTTAPYALYFVQPTPVTLELENGKKSSFISTRAKAGKTDYSAGIVSRNNLTIVGDGNLEAIGGSADLSNGIYSQAGLTITMSNKTNIVEAIGKTNGFNSATGSLAINGGTFIASGETEALPNLVNGVLFHGDYSWWYNQTPGIQSSYAYNATHEWLKFEVDPPSYAFYATTSTYTPIINSEKVTVNLTRRDVKNKGAIDPTFSGPHIVNVTFANASNPSNLRSAESREVIFNEGVGDYTDLTFSSNDSLILWFAIDDIRAINPVIITPVIEPTYGISLNRILFVFNEEMQNYLPQEPLTVTIINEGNQPTGLLTIVEPEKFAISRGQMPAVKLPLTIVQSIPVGGTATLQITPANNLPPGKYEETITISGEHDIEAEIKVSFTVKSKLPGEDVETPILHSKTTNSIFILANAKPNSGQEVEYAILRADSDEELEWLSFNDLLAILQFNDLGVNTAYNIYARTKENNNYKAGTISAPLSVTTDIMQGENVETPILHGKTTNSIIILANSKPSTGQEVEYAIRITSSDEELVWISFDELLDTLQFDGLDRNTAYDIYARAKANDTYAAGKISAPLQVTTDAASADDCTPFTQIAILRWGNTMTVIDNPENNGGLDNLSNFVWFKDGVELENGKNQSWSAGPNITDKYPPGKYHVAMTSGDRRIVSCEYEVLPPQIVQKTFAIDWSNVEFADVYSVSGKHLAKISTAAELRQIKNAYVLAIKTKTGKKQTIKATEAAR